MGRAFVALATAAAAVLSLGAVPQASIFDSYHAALAARKTPVNMEFIYTVTRSAPEHIITEQHRVYWSASGVERNDTIAINGTNLVPPRSALLHRTDWPYDVGQFAAGSDEYDATLTGLAVVANRKAYALKLVRAAQAEFMLTSLYVDANTRLPLRETFNVAGADCQGSGSIDFLPTGAYWLPSFVAVVCTGSTQGTSPAPVFKESIRFNGYHFPAAIPPDVFGQSAPDLTSTPSDAGGASGVPGP